MGRMIWLKPGEKSKSEVKARRIKMERRRLAISFGVGLLVGILTVGGVWYATH